MNTTPTRGRYREPATRPAWLLPALPALAAVVLLIVLAACSDSGSDFGEGEARVMCEDFVRDRLKSPSTGSFERPTVTALSAGQFRVTGDFDAENSFGGTVPGSYTCTVKGEDGTATLVALDLEDR